MSWRPHGGRDTSLDPPAVHAALQDDVARAHPPGQEDPERDREYVLRETDAFGPDQIAPCNTGSLSRCREGREGNGAGGGIPRSSRSSRQRVSRSGACPHKVTQPPTPPDLRHSLLLPVFLFAQRRSVFFCGIQLHRGFKDRNLYPGFPVVHNEPDQSASLSSSKSQSFLKIKAIDLHLVMCYT